MRAVSYYTQAAIVSTAQYNESTSSCLRILRRYIARFRFLCFFFMCFSVHEWVQRFTLISSNRGRGKYKMEKYEGSVIEAPTTGKIVYYIYLCVLPQEDESQALWSSIPPKAASYWRVSSSCERGGNTEATLHKLALTLLTKTFTRDLCYLRPRDRQWHAPERCRAHD